MTPDEAAAARDHLLPTAVAHLQHAWRGDEEAVTALLHAEGILGDLDTLHLFVAALTRVTVEILHLAADGQPKTIETFLAGLRTIVEQRHHTQ